MDHRDLNRIGRCCARCKSPWMCGRVDCPCHHDMGRKCRYWKCGAELYVAPPSAPSFRDVLGTSMREAA